MQVRSPVVGIIMGSYSDWETMEEAAKVLKEFGIPHESSVVSAHRTPDWMFEYAEEAEDNGLEVIIAGAGGAAHLPGMVASKTDLPVLGVPIQSKALNGMDSLLSIVQMPAGIPVGTLAIGTAGAKNAALLAARILGCMFPACRKKVRKHRESERDKVITLSNIERFTCTTDW
jgi:5-(carboxyamino)imidazole ribonucleotide mutase